VVLAVLSHTTTVLRTWVSEPRRSGGLLTVEPLEIEKFGENVGSLTREAFGLEVTRSRFHQQIENLVGAG
jgi:hypothetical protein